MRSATSLQLVSTTLCQIVITNVTIQNKLWHTSIQKWGYRTHAVLNLKSASQLKRPCRLFVDLGAKSSATGWLPEAMHFGLQVEMLPGDTD